MGKWLGRLLLALLLSLLVGVAIGTLLRLRLERPVYYIGAADAPRATLPCGSPPSLGFASLRGLLRPSPLVLGAAGAAVLDAGHHEEQVG